MNYGVDLYDDPHANHMNMVWNLENPVSGPYRMMGHPIKFTKTPVEPTAGAPTLGEHTTEILTSLGYDDRQIAELRDMKAVK